MSNYFYDLRDKDKLPLGAKFVDPFDKFGFVVNHKETLDEFISRIAARREDKALPEIAPNSLKQLAVASIYTSCKGADQNKYFKKSTAFPDSRQVISLAYTLAHQLIKGNQTSQEKRQLRAKKCLDDCKFHRPNSAWKGLANKVMSKVVGLESLSASDEERQLGTCSLCSDGGLGCNMRAKVAYDMGSIMAGLAPEYVQKMMGVYGPQAFSKCWMFKEALAHPKYNGLLKQKLRMTPSGEQFLKAFMAQNIAESRHGKR